MGIAKEQEISRRSFFRRAGATGVVAGAAVVSAGAALTAMPREAAASDVDAMIADKVGAGSVAYEKVNVDVPVKAENGALVRLPVSVDHPMEPGNYIQTVGVFVDNNPKPFVATFNFEPECGEAAFECRIKMAKSSPLRVIAKTNTGKLYGFKKEVQVAEGGCAG